MIPRICGALRVSRQLQKVFNLPAHMTQFKITADLDSNIAQIEATFLFDETLLKDDTDASERTTTGSETVAEQGETDGTAGTAEAVQGFRPAEAKDGFQAYKFWV
jgi:hypothetical protein